MAIYTTKNSCIFHNKFVEDYLHLWLRPICELDTVYYHLTRNFHICFLSDESFLAYQLATK
jgi:hypothetical protein